MFAVAGILVGLSASLVAYSALSTVLSEERRVTRRLRRLPDYERTHAAEIEPLLAPFQQRILRPSLNAVGRGIRKLAPSDYRARLASWTHRAGAPLGLDVDRILALKALLGGIALIVTVAVSAASGRPPASVALFSLLAGAATFLLPDLWIHERGRERQDAIRRALPDMLDMLTISVEAGLGFDAAVSKLVRTTSGPLAEEFAVMLHEVSAGLARREALRNLADRTDVPDLSTFVMAMVQADVFGISVASVLRTQSHEMRRKRHQYAQEMAQKAPAKMVFPIVLCILPATLIVLMGPAVISIGKAFDLL